MILVVPSRGYNDDKVSKMTVEMRVIGSVGDMSGGSRRENCKMVGSGDIVGKTRKLQYILIIALIPF